ncbi:chemokine-like receptor 1 [Alosa sapidissima]|uniref:chemokine-like receptor 1 n=1 Tax=Alosa sapidissima TaxID=34773 RepID=UPI001C088F62|nr:chemokine-like receptor 1 [Alosa sapidissima]
MGEGINGTLDLLAHDGPDNYTDLGEIEFSNSDGYTYDPEPEPPASLSCDALCAFVLASNIIIFILGIVGNGLVIWIIGKTKRTVNSSWYLSLAVSDFLFCTTVPFNGVYMATGHWHFGLFMCKFISVAFPLNMYSSIFLLLVISVDRCMCVVFPVWTQNHRTLRRSSAIIVLVWIVSALLTLPSLVFPTTQTIKDQTKCIHDHNSTAFSRESVVLIGFVFGLAIPLMVIVICYSVIMLKLRANRMMRSSKPFKVMTAVIITFVMCWLPFQIFRLMEVYYTSCSSALLKTGIQVTITIAYANSFMNPILYSFMGQDFRNKCLMSILSRMESALQEEDRSTKAMSMSKSSS